MASVQERLQLKRMPLENWSISEQLYLASAVACSGDQNWMSVSRQLKSVCGNNRPSDWFSQKSCAAQYEMLLENVEPTKRKKRNEKDTLQTIAETPIELIVRKLTQERIQELNKVIQEEREEFQKLRNEITSIQSNAYDENQLREMLQQIENEEKQREREKQKQAQWLKEREEKKHEMERAQWAKNAHSHQSPSNLHSPALTQHLNQKVKVEDVEMEDPNSKHGTSPLLTSLLKSPSAAPNPSSSMLHNMPNQTRVSAPTITNLLTGSVANLSSSLSAAQQSVTKTIASSGSSITTPYPTQMHNQPLTGPPSSDQLIGITQSPSQAAPTLSMLLESKQKENMMKIPPLARIDSQNAMCSMEQHPGADTTKTEPTDSDFNSAESPIKDEDQQLMEVFNDLPEDIDELADIISDVLMEEEQSGGVSHATENLDAQVNLDLKTFQSQPAHSSESSEIKEEPINVSEGTCDSTVAPTKIEDPFDELKESKNSIPLIHMEEEKKVSLELQKDEDSDLSNDTPLSELIKQDTSAKQMRAQQLTPKDISSTTEQVDESESKVESETDQPVDLDEEENLLLEDDKVEDTTDLLENQLTEPENFSESAQQQMHQDEFESKSPLPDEKPSKIEIDMPIDSFESDSNEEKSMENIKRKIDAITELKDSNSSENSQDEKIGNDDAVEIEEKYEAESTEQILEKMSDDAVDQIIEDNDSKETEQIEEPAVNVEQDAENDENDENIESISIKDESNDLTLTKEETNEQNEPDEAICDTEEAEKSEPTEAEPAETMENEPCQSESVKSTEEETKEEQAVDSTAADNVVEILDDDILDKDEIMQEPEETKEEVTAEADSSQPDMDDLIEIKSDDEKQEEAVASPKEKTETNEEPESSVKIEIDETVTESKEKSETPAPAERKISTDDELFEDAKETLDVEVKPPKPITPVIPCDTDDDSVIEVVKEEKVGVKRDYSRRKKDHSHSEKRSEERTPSEDGGSISSRLRLKDRYRSESPFIEEDSGEPLSKSKRRYSSTPVIDSLPNSPASSDDREYRSWKKSILLLYNSLASHRCASIFAKPITDDQAPNYKKVILHPMDLQSLKRNIDSGQIRNTLDFQLYVMRMCYNAIFYNINDDLTCSRAKEMLQDALQLIAEFSVTWKKENEKPSSLSSTSSNVTKSVRGRKSNRLMN